MISVPVSLMDGVIGFFDGLTRLFPNLEASLPYISYPRQVL